jgi:hypothetical protein
MTVPSLFIIDSCRNAVNAAPFKPGLSAGQVVTGDFTGDGKPEYATRAVSEKRKSQKVTTILPRNYL